LIHKIWKTIKHSLLPTKTYMGIEITDYAVKVVLLTNITSNNTKLLAYTIEPLSEQCMDEGKIVDAFRLLQTIQTAVNRLDVKVKKAHFALPSPIVMVRFLKLPDLAKKEMNKLVDFEMKHNIHLPFEQPFYDYLKMNGQSEDQLNKKRLSSKNTAVKNIKEGRQQAAAAQTDPLFELTIRTKADASSSIDELVSEQLCDVMLVAAPRDRVEEYVQIIRNAHVELASMEIKPLSLYRTIRKIDNNDTITHQTFLLVDLGRMASDVSIFHDGQLKITRNIYINFPIGKDSKKALNENDLLSNLDSTGGDTDFINTCSELVHELERLINFYRYTLNHRDHEFERVIISGDVERIDEIRSYVEERLARAVSIISCDHIQSEEADLKLIFPSIANAFGLALRGNSDL
jgi:type IV pilus assembly protein PilM